MRAALRGREMVGERAGQGEYCTRWPVSQFGRSWAPPSHEALIRRDQRRCRPAATPPDLCPNTADWDRSTATPAGTFSSPPRHHHQSFGLAQG